MTKLFEVVSRDAKLSPCENYRYWLSRKIRALDPAVRLVGRVLFIMLNPSTADAKIDDRTINRCMGFTFRFGCEELIVVNLFALRSKDPGALWKAADPVGPENDKWIAEYALPAVEIVAAWGGMGRYLNRDRKVIDMLWGRGKVVHHLGLNGDGTPKHPLYLPNESKRLVLT